MIAKKRMVCNWRRIRQSRGADGPLPPLSVGTNKTFHSCHLRERGEWMAAVVMEEIMEACMKTKIWILFCKHLIKSESSQSTIVISLVLRLMPIELNRSGKKIIVQIKHPLRIIPPENRLRIHLVKSISVRRV